MYGLAAELAKLRWSYRRFTPRGIGSCVCTNVRGPRSTAGTLLPGPNRTGAPGSALLDAAVLALAEVSGGGVMTEPDPRMAGLRGVRRWVGLVGVGAVSMVRCGWSCMAR